MPKQIHEDFGEKIGGAKKDLWSVRGLYTDDLDEMNEREAEKYVKKDNSWKKPDYQAMLRDNPGFKDIRVGVHPPREGKDYNEMLQIRLQHVNQNNQRRREKQAAFSI